MKCVTQELYLQTCFRDSTFKPSTHDCLSHFWNFWVEINLMSWMICSCTYKCTIGTVVNWSCHVVAHVLYIEDIESEALSQPKQSISWVTNGSPFKYLFFGIQGYEDKLVVFERSRWGMQFLASTSNESHLNEIIHI